MPSNDEQPSPLTSIVRELPRRRVAVLLAIVVVHLVVATCWRGYGIGRERRNAYLIRTRIDFEVGTMAGWARQKYHSADEYINDGPIVPPTDWTAREWRESFPW